MGVWAAALTAVPKRPADTIAAKNSLEKMLAYQLAAAHRSTMKLTALASFFPRPYSTR